MENANRMRYFLLKPDKDEVNIPNLRNWYSKVNPCKIGPQTAHELPKRVLLDLEPSVTRVFTDVVLSPFLLVSQTVRDVIAFYEPKLIYKDIVLLDRENHASALYYLPILESVDCLVEGTKFNLDKSLLKHAVIDPAMAKGRSMFKLGGVLNSYIVVRLDLVESILRREVRGVSLELLKCVEYGKGGQGVGN